MDTETQGKLANAGLTGKWLALKWCVCVTVSVYSSCRSILFQQCVCESQYVVV